MELIADEIKLRQDAIAYQVVNKLKNVLKDTYSILYYNFPLYRGDVPNDIIQAKLLLAAPTMGVIYFTFLSEERELNETEKQYLENLDAHIFQRFIKRAELRINKRSLKFGVSAVVISKLEFADDDYIYVQLSNLKNALDKLKQVELNQEEFNILLGCIEGTAKMVTKKVRNVSEENKPTKKGDILTKIQERETVFDIEQKQVALVTIDGPQRIRGLAGSGKTIILAMKAAHYHLSHPQEEILYTYYTKSLYGLIKNLIERFYRDFSDNQEPNWKKIHILHGWGGTNLEGVYSSACTDNGIPPITFKEANIRRTDQSSFAYVCSEMTKNILKPKYDLTLIDEGQDFPNEFYRLCYDLSKDKRIVWAYDDFQDIFDTKVQDEKHLFGTDEKGFYLVDFSRAQRANQDIVLHVCYRTPMTILISAFCLGLGIYNEKVLQRLVNNAQWEALGFKVESGKSNDGDEMVISRPKENTPSIMNELFEGVTVYIQNFNNLADECNYIVSCIVNDIQNENLRPDDICIICLDNRNINKYYNCLEPALYENGIRTFNILNAPNTNQHFFYENSVTLGTINRAKGNEAGMVYIIGADAVFRDRNNVIERNRLFTAMTRAKGWVTITGTGEGALLPCIEEIKKLKENNFKLIFTQPSIKDTRTIKTGSESQLNEISKFESSVESLRKSGLSTADLIRLLSNK